jgi:hypothetical protein
MILCTYQCILRVLSLWASILKKRFNYLLVDFFDGVLSSFFLRSSVIMAALS